MTEHNLLTGSSLHEPKGVSAALAGQAYLANGAGSGAWATVLSSAAVKEIEQESDFDVQDGTTITLESQTQYIITNSFTTTKNFIVQDSAVFSSISTLGPLVTYTGTNPMFSGTDVHFVIKDVQLTNPNSETYSFTDTVGGVKAFLSNSVRCLSCTKYGTFNDMQTVLIETGANFDADDGITVTGSNGLIFSIDKHFMASTSATYKGVDWGSSVIQTIEIRDFITNAPGGAFALSGLANSGNVPTTRLAMVENCEFGGGLTSLENITNEDIRWSFRGNTPIADTIEDAMVSLTNNATETVIASIGVPVKVAGTWVCERDSLFTCATTGRLTYVGERDKVLPIDIVVTTIAASGTNKDIKTYLALNGTVITNSGKKDRVGSTDPSNTSVIWQLNLTTNDFLEVFTENNTDTVNLVVEDAILRAR